MIMSKETDKVRYSELVRKRNDKRTKTLLAVIACLALAFVICAAIHPETEQFDADGENMAGPTLTWKIEGSVLKFEGFGPMYNTWIHYDNPEAGQIDNLPGWYGSRASIESISLSNRLTTISPYAFYGLSEVESLFIPASVSSADSTAFRGMSALATIQVDEKNTRLYVENQALLISEQGFQNLHKKGNSIQLLKYPSASETTNYILPNSITSLMHRVDN